MAPVKSVTLRPAKKMPMPMSGDYVKAEIVEDDSLSVRSFDSRDSRDEPFRPRSFETLRRAITPPPKIEGIEEGMRCEVANQIRDRRGLGGFRTELPKGEEDKEPDHVLQPEEDWLKQFAVVARKRLNPCTSIGSDLDSVRIRSPLLKQILRDLCKEYPGFSGHKGKSLFPMDMYEPFDGLFHCWDELLRLEEEHHNPDVREHIRLLHEVLEPYFKKPLKKLEECRKNGNITYNSLWTIFKPGELIYRKDVNGRECVERIDDMYYGANKDRIAFKVESKMVCWDGKRFGYGLSCGWFYDFSGTMSVMDLSAVPLAFHPDREAIKARMTIRGERFQRIAGCQLKAYTGPEGEAAYRRSPTNKTTQQTVSSRQHLSKIQR